MRTCACPAVRHLRWPTEPRPWSSSSTKTAMSANSAGRELGRRRSTSSGTAFAPLFQCRREKFGAHVDPWPGRFAAGGEACEQRAATPPGVSMRKSSSPSTRRSTAWSRRRSSGTSRTPTRTCSGPSSRSTASATRCCSGGSPTRSSPSRSRTHRRTTRSPLRSTGRPRYSSRRPSPNRPGPWTTVIDGDVVDRVRRLKEQPGSAILVNGSIRLSRTLLDAGLAYEAHLFIHPIVVGRGQRLFREDGPRSRWPSPPARPSPPAC